MKIFKPDGFSGECIQMRRLDSRIARESQIAIALVVRDDKNDIRFGGPRRVQGHDREQRAQR